jgi:hypothetical protein
MVGKPLTTPLSVLRSQSILCAAPAPAGQNIETPALTTFSVYRTLENKVKQVFKDKHGTVATTVLIYKFLGKLT